MSEPVAVHLDRATAERLLGCTWHGSQRSCTFHGAAIDSRRATSGCLFACFEGEHVDGHDYADAAVSNGAACVLAECELDLPVPVLEVPDSAAALQALARHVRRRYVGAKWIGITGSNGKTTVKELLRAACEPAGPVHATAGNLNNHLGVPLTILATPPGCKTVIIEMGASACGEIAFLAAIAEPDIGVITGIAPAHLEGFGSLRGVAQGKTELFTALPAGAPALFSRYGLDENCAAAGIDPAELMTIVEKAAAGRALQIINPDAAGQIQSSGIHVALPAGTCDLPLSGGHNIANAHLAWRTAMAAGVDGEQALVGLQNVKPVAGRLTMQRLGGHRLYDDSYNANPASMNAGLSVLTRQPGIRIAVFGGMGELGPEGAEMHRRVGVEAARQGVVLITVGEAAAAIAEGYRQQGGRDCEHAADLAQAQRMLRGRMAVGPSSVLIKASRSAGLDQLVRALLDAPPSEAEQC